MNKKNLLKVIDKDGKEKDYEIIVMFKWIDKNYVVYTDNTTNNDDELNVYAAIYYPNDNSRLDSIETNEEWNKIDEVLSNLNRGVIN